MQQEVTEVDIWVVTGWNQACEPIVDVIEIIIESIKYFGYNLG